MNNEIVAEWVGNLTVMQLIALTKELEEKWGVKAAPQIAEPIVFIPTVGPVLQTEFEVVFVSFAADKKMTLVKLVREVMALGLLESKTLVESLPKTIKGELSKDDAEILKAKFVEAGGVVEIK